MSLTDAESGRLQYVSSTWMPLRRVVHTLIDRARREKPIVNAAVQLQLFGSLIGPRNLAGALTPELDLFARMPQPGSACG